MSPLFFLILGCFSTFSAANLIGLLATTTRAYEHMSVPVCVAGCAARCHRSSLALKNGLGRRPFDYSLGVN